MGCGLLSRIFPCWGSRVDKLEEPGNEYNTFQMTVLVVVNHYRRCHGSPPLQLNSEICRIAQGWADCLAADNLMGHSPKEQRVYRGKTCAENLAYNISSKQDEFLGKHAFLVQLLIEAAHNDVISVVMGDKAVEKWYHELEDYDFQHPGKSIGTSQFTALVWKSTTLLGVGVAKKTTPAGVVTAVVANFWPPGNIPGKFSKNVSEPDDISADGSSTFEALEDDVQPLAKRIHVASQDHASTSAIVHADGMPISENHRGSQDTLAAVKTQVDQAEKHQKQSNVGGNNVSQGVPDETDIDVDKSESSIHKSQTLSILTDDEDGDSIMLSPIRLELKPNTSPRGSALSATGPNVSEQLPGMVMTANDLTLDLDLFRFAALEAHNRYRYKHGSPPMQLDGNLNDKAQCYAEQLLADGELLSRSTNTKEQFGGPCGENVAVQTLDDGDIKLDEYSGRFTTLIWRASQELGIGVAYAKRGGATRIYTVANYSPVGNSGSFEDNVFPDLTSPRPP